MTNSIDEQLNLRKRHPFGRFFLLQNNLESWLITKFGNGELDISYGKSPGQKMDIFPAKIPSSPVFIFIHGGYFRALDKRQYRYIARQTRAAGYTTVLLNYDLAPKVSVTEIVQQILRAFQWIGQHISGWHGDPNRIILCGHSVGAFLVAKILETFDKHTHPVQKAMLLSGLFDLKPMQQSYLNQDLQLTDSEVAHLSPQNGTLKQHPKMLIAVGGEETREFINQSRVYSEKLKRDQIHHKLLIMPGLNHYSMSRTLAGKKSAILHWLERPHAI